MSWEEKTQPIEAKLEGEGQQTWYQSREDVVVKIGNLPANLTSKSLDIKFSARHLRVAIKGQQTPIIDGALSAPIKPSDSTWTIETVSNAGVTSRLVTVVLAKVQTHQVWPSLLEGGQVLNAAIKDKVERQMMLEKFQLENPGFDFSGAELTGNVPTDPTNFMHGGDNSPQHSPSTF